MRASSRSRAAGGSFGTDQIVPDTWTVPEMLAAIAGISAAAADDQQVHLALRELVQPSGFHDPQPDRRMGGAEAVQPQADEIETGIDAYGQDYGNSLRLEPFRRVPDAAKSFLHSHHVLLPGRSEGELLVQPLEKTHAEASLEGFYLLPDGARRDVQLARSQLEAQVARRGFECAQRVQRWQQIGHGLASSCGRRAIDFL
jgi:hypothetical protein